MVSRDYIFNNILSAMIILTVWSLWSLGESRLDAYVSLYTLEYLVLKAILRPRRSTRDWIAIILVGVFIVAVSIRIYSVVA